MGRYRMFVRLCGGQAVTLISDHIGRGNEGQLDGVVGVDGVREDAALLLDDLNAAASASNSNRGATY